LFASIVSVHVDVDGGPGTTGVVFPNVQSPDQVMPMAWSAGPWAVSVTELLAVKLAEQVVSALPQEMPGGLDITVLLVPAVPDLVTVRVKLWPSAAHDPPKLPLVDGFGL
jgi:hypothetical protein